MNLKQFKMDGVDLMDWVDYGIPHAESKLLRTGYRANVQPLKPNVCSAIQAVRTPGSISLSHALSMN